MDSMNKIKKSQFKWIFQRTKNSRFLLTLLIFVSAATSLTTVLLAYIVRGFVDIATKDSDSTLSRYVILTLVVIVVLGTVYVLSIILRSALFARIEGRTRADFLKSVFTRSFVDIQKVHSSEMMMLLSEDIAETSRYFPVLIYGIFRNSVLLVASVTAMFFMSWQLALIVMITLPVMMVVLNFFAPFIQRKSKKNKQDEELNRKHMHESVVKLTLFKAYDMLNKVTNKHNSLYKLKYKSTLKLATLEGVSAFINMLFSFGVFLILLGVGAFFVLRGDVTVGVLVAMLNLMGNITGPFSTVSEHISQIAKSNASAQRLKNVMELPHEKSRSLNLSHTPKLLKMNNIEFAYGDNIVLRGASIEAKINEITGIIGESGSGKSTLTKVLMGLYTPKSGTITLQDINGNTLEDILSLVSYVPSENFLFSGTIEENICMGETLNLELLELAAKSANIHDFILTLPNGYQEVIGESSNLLSSGQGQRIAIARALYKDSPILIFDEPTSNLDVESISELHILLKDICKEKMCILITHDISTKNICNKVYNIVRGKAEVLTD